MAQFLLFNFSYLSVPTKPNIRARLGNITLGPQSEVYNFHAVYKELDREVFP